MNAHKKSPPKRAVARGSIDQLRLRSATSMCRTRCSSSACSFRSSRWPRSSPPAWPACSLQSGPFPSPAPM